MLRLFWGKNCRLYFKALMLVWYGWKPRGWVSLRESLSFGWRYGSDVIATTPFIILYIMISLEMVLLSSKVFQFRKFSISVTLLVLWDIWLLCVGQIQASVSPPPLNIWIPHTGAVLKGWRNNCLVCFCFYRGLSCANVPLYKTKGFIGFGSDVVNVSVPF